MRRAFSLVLAFTALVGCSRDSEGPSPGPGSVSEAELRAAVTQAGLTEHVRALARIADENGGNRAAGTPGYEASVGYVRETLERAGYEVRIQEFPFRSFAAEVEARVVGPRARKLAAIALQYSGEGSVSGVVAEAGDGCQGSDFGGSFKARVALVERGLCPFLDKMLNAEEAGASGLLVYNNQPGSISGTLGRPDVAKIPALGLRAEVGQELAREAPAGDTTVALDVRTTVRDSSSENVIAELPGTKGRIVLAGGHLDSVPVGPGVNDNGSGVATLLEVAEQLAARGPSNLRFAFWGGEEAGLVGSRYYVDHLEGEETKEIVLYFNLDMVGSQNFERLVYESGPSSRTVMRLLSAYFKKRGLASSTVELGGSSDHAPFADRSIPVSGLFSGAGEPAPNGKPYDPCYHERCDDLGNVHFEVLHELADATAYALVTVASDPSLVE